MRESKVEIPVRTCQSELSTAIATSCWTATVVGLGVGRLVSCAQRKPSFPIEIEAVSSLTFSALARRVACGCGRV